MRVYQSVVWILLLLTVKNVYAQTPAAPAPATTTPAVAAPAALTKPTPDPKREFRGAWIATVVNIDWPTSPKDSPDQQKAELLTILNSHQRTGINAVMFQVRPAADAFYAKGREPWSKYLTGKQGQPPVPFYDPLEFAITEAHKRGMELHAWFNPYRATFDGNFAALAPTHITRLKPEWFFTYGGIKLFNPGIPEVREYIVRVILDVVDNYDIDGVHMDDYFYPYAIAGQHINDAATFKQYGGDFTDINEWRRDNVNKLIEMLSDSIHAHKPFLKFGISPFGIWKNKGQDPEGSETTGGDSYYELYADSREWIKQGWVDYINPQLYWNIGYRLAAFDKLLDWWSNNTYGRHLYVGMAAYRINEQKNRAFKDPSQLPQQLALIRANPRVQGSVYFNSQSLLSNPLGFTDSLRTHFYRYPALPPPMVWLDSIAPKTPVGLTARKVVRGIELSWQTPPPAADKEPVYGYVVYRFTGAEKFNLNDPKYIVHIQYSPETTWTDTTANNGANYIYMVTALDRLKNESEHSEPASVKLP